MIAFNSATTAAAENYRQAIFIKQKFLAGLSLPRLENIHCFSRNKIPDFPSKCHGISTSETQTNTL